MSSCVQNVQIRSHRATSCYSPCFVQKDIAEKASSSVYTIGNVNNKSLTPRSRRFSYSALYEVWRKDLSDVCYLFVPDENDLVKSHLMFAVREEVEVLKEKIQELMERIGHLERENTILRSAASQDTLSKLLDQTTTTSQQQPSAPQQQQQQQQQPPPPTPSQNQNQTQSQPQPPQPSTQTQQQPPPQLPEN